MQYDVVVLGAGTAGAAAAIAAADCGANVLAVEQFGGAGGSSALGLVTPLMSPGIPGRPQCSYIGLEIIDRLYRENASDGNKKCFFDPVMLSVVLEEMLYERGVKMLYHTMITGVEMNEGHITGVKISNAGGSGTVRASRRYIDATGDALVCHFAGLTTMHGDEEHHRNQPCSLRYMIGGVDTDRFWRFLSEIRGTPDAPRPENYDGAATFGQGSWKLNPLFQKAAEDGELLREDALYWQFFTVPGRRDVIAFNCPEFFDIDDITNAENQSDVQVHGKLRILRHLRFYRKHLPGFENAYIAQISPMVGIREGRRAVTEYVLTTEDAFFWRKFDDAVAQTNYPVDVHGRKLLNQDLARKDDEPRKYYEIPFRSLIVKGVDNLLVAGRNIGAEFIAQSSLRIIPTCRALGEAAGIAAALDLNDGSLIRAEMIKRGAEFV
ncbi:MAG: FAD-dependent oxidoreductase [Clostridia bacterium]|nr:FAD-dependent oxidoreductase [Clostridia bacterium]